MGKLTVKGTYILKAGNLSYTNIIAKQSTIPKRRVRIKEMRIALEIRDQQLKTVCISIYIYMIYHIDYAYMTFIKTSYEMKTKK